MCIQQMICLLLLAIATGACVMRQAVFQITALTSLGVAANRYSTDAAVLLEAVRQLAGPASGLSVVDSASLVVNTLKIIQTLEKIGEQLQVCGTVRGSTVLLDGWPAA